MKYDENAAATWKFKMLITYSRRRRQVYYVQWDKEVGLLYTNEGVGEEAALIFICDLCWVGVSYLSPLGVGSCG